MPDVYYHPEKFGLATIGEIDWDDEPYQFALTAVWRDTETGQLFWASDSGCSCPAPFEDFTSREHLETGTPAELDAMLAESLAGLEKSTYRSSSAPRVRGEIADLMLKVTNA